MLTIVVEEKMFLENKTNKVLRSPKTTLVLEHSLVSISKWEAKWKKAFLSKDDKTEAEIIDYIRCMTITQNVDPLVYLSLSNSNIMDIKNYIDDSMTATKFYSDKKDENTFGSKHRDTITSELIYYWMTVYGIPVEFQKWHINRLLTLIRVCSVKNNENNKMSKKDSASTQARINRARRGKKR